jgi:hypothetical protein
MRRPGAAALLLRLVCVMAVALTTSAGDLAAAAQIAFRMRLLDAKRLLRILVRCTGTALPDACARFGRC